MPQLANHDSNQAVTRRHFGALGSAVPLNLAKERKAADNAGNVKRLFLHNMFRKVHPWRLILCSPPFRALCYLNICTHALNFRGC